MTPRCLRPWLVLLPLVLATGWGWGSLARADEEKPAAPEEPKPPPKEEPKETVRFKVEGSEGPKETKEVPREKSAYGPIQRRLYDMDQELSLGWAYLPLDPYYKGYGVMLAYTIHFSHIMALELFRVGWSYNIDSKLKTKLIEQMPDISPAEFPGVLFFENTNLIFKLLYGKQSLLNRTALHFEIFATAGVAFLFRNPYNVFDMDFENYRLEFGINAGFGFRIWINPTWSVRVDLRDTVILLGLNRGDFPLENSALVGLSLSVNL